MTITGEVEIGNQRWVAKWNTRTNRVLALRNGRLKYSGGVSKGKLFLDGCIFGCVIERLSNSLKLNESG